MRRSKIFAVGLAMSVFSAGAGLAADLDKVAVSVARLLEQGHYSRQKLDDGVSSKLLDQYLDDLDPNKMFFTQEDIDGFNTAYRLTLDNSILSGNLDPAREIFTLYKRRIGDRVASNKKLADKDYSFKSDRRMVIDRKKAPWAKNMAELDDLWARQIEASLLAEKLNDNAVDPPAKVVKRRQDQMLRNVEEMDDESVVSGFLGALSRTYDPHSEYLSPSELENFEIEMRKSLDGVGAVLQSEDGYAEVRQVVPGGPADLEGTLQVGDRISRVAQGSGEFEDVVEMKLDKVVEKIRGKRGTTVRLEVIPANATDPSQRKIIAIRRDEVQLKEQKASAELIDLKKPDGTVEKVGWIELPSFYGDMGNPSEEAVSTTRDVSVLLERLKKEGIDGLVIDLRRDGGGSLEEAINLTGLFIPQGPVVQAKDSNGKVSVSYDEDNKVLWDGPMVVVMNRLSASASEIFAAALQDYGRAVIVGDERSFGKGTVQQMLDIGRLVVPFFNFGSADAGALKLTINKFYRVKGGSTQLEGVKSDIVLPSLTDNPEFGEGALPNPLPYDEVAPQRIASDGSMASLLPQLRALSEGRVRTDPEFGYIVNDMTRLRERIADNTVSLNLSDRKAEIDADKKRTEARKTEREKRGPAFDVQAFEITLDNAADPELKKVAFDRKKHLIFDLEEDPEASDKKGEKDEVAPDAIRNETIRIAVDLIDLTQDRRTAAVKQGKVSAE